MTASPGSRLDAAVVGAGPNGLAAAITLAQAGCSVQVLERADEIGGGARSAELTLPGIVHDVCSAIHPTGAASPFLRSLPLAAQGLRWAQPEVAVAHPLDDGRAASLTRDLAETADRLGADGAAWRRLFGPLATRFDRVAADLFGPPVHVPRHGITIPAGVLALAPAAAVARAFATPEGRALWGGIAAHGVQPFTRPMSSAAGIMLTAAGHVAGWPVAAGGSGRIAEALAAHLRSLGGEIHTGVEVRNLRDLPEARVALLDVTPRQLLAIAGDRLPPAARRRAQRWRFGPAAFKVDYAVEGGVPWQADACRVAGTVHVGGGYEEIAAAESDVGAGRLTERPFVLLAQQYLADPARSPGDVHPVWAYCHVPNGYDGPPEVPMQALEGQIERFAPGFRDRIVARHVWTVAGLEAHNPNHVGGDIAGGATDLGQMIARPRLSPDPYATGLPGLFLCSSSTPPGPGVHGLCGHRAGRSALRALGITG